jgi:SAM-dependent methyltransferase
MKKITISWSISYLLEVIQNLWIDLLIQGRSLAGDVASIDDRKVINLTGNARIRHIKLIFFHYIHLHEKDVIVDVGCGKGRVFNYLLYKGVKSRMIGYEINPVVGRETKKHLSKYKNVTIIPENIFDNFPVDGNIFFLNNPFRGPMLEEFKDRIWEIRNNNPVVFYLHAVHIASYDTNRFEYEIVKIKNQKWTFDLAIIKTVKQA